MVMLIKSGIMLTKLALRWGIRRMIMKIVNMSVSNYRQFKYAELNFNDGIAVLAGANNSGKHH